MAVAFPPRLRPLLLCWRPMLTACQTRHSLPDLCCVWQPAAPTCGLQFHRFLLLPCCSCWDCRLDSVNLTCVSLSLLRLVLAGRYRPPARSAACWPYLCQILKALVATASISLLLLMQYRAMQVREAQVSTISRKPIEKVWQNNIKHGCFIAYECTTACVLSTTH